MKSSDAGILSISLRDVSWRAKTRDLIAATAICLVFCLACQSVLNFLWEDQ